MTPKQKYKKTALNIEFNAVIFFFKNNFCKLMSDLIK